MTEPLPSVVAWGEGARLLREQGVLMVYSKWVRPLRRGLEAGQLVVVEDEEGRLLGCALYDTVGPVALRVVELGRCSYGTVGELLRDRLRSALEARRAAGLLEGEAPAYRLVHSDGDMLPGLIVDVYDGLAVVQSSSAAWDRHLGELAEALEEVVGVEAVYEKSTQRTRRDIGLEPREGPLRGRPRLPVVVEEAGVRFLVDPRRGQKTGFFLDQRLNRIDFGRMAGGRVLDLFAYTGGFGIHALVNGAEEAVFVEEDREAVEMLRENLRLNRVEDRARIVAENAWSYIRRALGRRERFDSVAADPPAFIPHPGARERGLRGYRRLYRDAARLAARGALLFLSSCSTHLARDEFTRVVAEALMEAGRGNYTPLGGVRGMPPDHPVRPGAPHLEYLKALFLRLH